MNKVLKDIIVKAKGLAGYNAPYVPGWDCHGLPIEHKVETTIGKIGDKFQSASEFRDACREYAATQIERQKVDFNRLGILGDWEAPYLTMDYQVEADIVRSLGRIINNGHFHQGAKPSIGVWIAKVLWLKPRSNTKINETWTVDVAFTIQNTDQIRICLWCSSILPILPRWRFGQPRHGHYRPTICGGER